MISIIVCQDLCGGIGTDNQIPWKLPSDLKRFKDLTTGKTVVMGRTTYESLPKEYRPLPKRSNYVLSKKHKSGVAYPKTDGSYWFGDLETAILGLDGEIFIIGGEQVYKEVLNSVFTDRIYITTIFEDFKCNKFFPQFDKDKFNLICQQFDNKAYPNIFEIWQRKI